VLSVASLAAGGASTAHADPAEHVRELGRVKWQRDFDTAVLTASAEDRPIFLLFQEVPGCTRCVDFGELVLADPLLVEAIETEFVPVAILNNRGGADREVLDRFDEPAWNNPVVRFVDAGGRDLIPRADGVFSAAGISERMIASLEAAQRSVPPYLALAAAEARARFPRRATFETHCFWAGEGCLGDLPGVVGTTAAWLGGREAVEVRFDPHVVSYSDLLRAARARDCAHAVFARGADEAQAAAEVFGDAVRETDAPIRRADEADQKRHLRASELAGLDLTPMQRTRVNAALANGTDPLRWLSPRQRAEAAITRAGSSRPM